MREVTAHDVFSALSEARYTPQVTVPPEFQDQVSQELAERAVRGLLIRPWGEDQTDRAARRMAWVVEKVRDYWQYLTIRFRLVPLVAGTHPPPPEELQRDKNWDDWHEGTTLKRGYLVGKHYYETPEGAIDEIDDRSDSVYRGMSYDEWEDSLRRGAIQSRGEYNIGQGGLTFYGRAGTAVSYAGGFGPENFQPSWPDAPGVVIEIPRKFVLDHTQRRDITQGEFAHFGAVPLTEVTRAWKLVVTSVREGYIEARVYYRPSDSEGHPTGRVTEGSGGGMSRQYAIVPMEVPGR